MRFVVNRQRRYAHLQLAHAAGDRRGRWRSAVVREVLLQFVDSAEAHLGPISYRIETVEGTVLEGSDSESTVRATLRTSGKQATLIIDEREIILEL